MTTKETEHVDTVMEWLNKADPFHAQQFLGIISYLYIMKPTNATDFEVKLSNFSYKGEVLGDLKINIKLAPKAPKEEV